MKNIIKIVRDLQATNSRLEKEAILKKAWNDRYFDFFTGAKLCYNPYITFGVADKMVPDKDSNTIVQPQTTMKDFNDFTNKLINRELTGNAARDSLEDFMNRSDKEEWNTFFRPVLLRDLRIGCSEKTINKIASGNHEIKKFAVQLAKDGAEEVFADKRILQFKLDGVRFITFCDIENQTVTHYSRNGKENHNFPYITEAFRKLLPKLSESMVFDGEMMGESFQSLMTQVNRKDNVDTKNNKLVLFDCLPLQDFKNGVSEIPQSQRIEMLNQFLRIIEDNAICTLPILTVDLSTEKGQKDFAEFNKKAISEGKEGIMVKDPNAPYECKRSKHWLKIKPFISVALPVIAIEEGTGKNTGMCGALVCRGYDSCYNDKEILVNVGSGLSDEQRKEFWQNRDKLIGFIAEIKADVITKDRSDDTTYSLRFPRFVGFRGSTPGEQI